MVKVLVLMTVGILLGVIVGKYKALVKVVDHLITWSIFLLLFLLGVSVGINDKIMNNLDEIGVNALIITLGALIGSVFVAWLLFRFVFSKKEVSKSE